ncbi:hypothetical protein TWF569_006864 [Orbilia oligospora]|uniref:Uncharacterized protein n=1 Tax=Orbilia oligospora TaxID=2813651 RepID=A0A7C8NT77_ORBOL|nr:hypothetical protein TWF102_000774 [Orbilia oligospora]KAF3100949.1 hypothetical protein TWF706_006042 [Orbilia oligospora]KAF3116592.1 hypothetical protein TWF103_008355 [Orbilia oligospora]KAF3128152.1 hypothetical protein TWF594_011722 [Orbilia oligospora]KAF3135233.1 hypothetical protein TWF703_006147 [Orbilia oligospora]
MVESIYLPLYHHPDSDFKAEGIGKPYPYRAPAKVPHSRALINKNATIPILNIQGPEWDIEPHRALYINEILEHILSFVVDHHLMTTKEENYSCKDSDGFWDLIRSCRMQYKIQERIVGPAGLISALEASSKLFVKELKLEEERPRITLCYPFLAWLFRTIREMTRIEVERCIENSTDDSQIDLEDLNIDWRQLKERFALARFPNVFFTDPPISEARLHFDTNHPIVWPTATSGSTTLTLGEMEIVNSHGVSVRGVRCISSVRADGILRNGVLISNKKGVTLHDIIYAFDEYIKMATDPECWWNKGKPTPWQLRWLSVGTVTMYPEREDSTVIGACEVHGVFDLVEMDEHDRDEFKIYDLTIEEQVEKKSEQ